MNVVISLFVISLAVVSAKSAVDLTTETPKNSTCPCSPEDKQEYQNSRLRIAFLVLQDYKTKLEINKIEKELGMKETPFVYEPLAQEDISVLNQKVPDCVCGRDVEREKNNTYLRTAYLTLFSYKAQLDIIKLQKEMSLPQTSFELDKIVWPENVVKTAVSTRVRRQTKCSNGCILYCGRYGGVRYNEDGSCTKNFKCQCLNEPSRWP